MDNESGGIDQVMAMMSGMDLVWLLGVTVLLLAAAAPVRCLVSGSRT